MYDWPTTKIEGGLKESCDSSVPFYCPEIRWRVYILLCFCVHNLRTTVARLKAQTISTKITCIHHKCRNGSRRLSDVRAGLDQELALIVRLCVLASNAMWSEREWDCYCIEMTICTLPAQLYGLSPIQLPVHA